MLVTFSLHIVDFTAIREDYPAVGTTWLYELPRSRTIFTEEKFVVEEEWLQTHVQ
jgi:hypothetical protein